MFRKVNENLRVSGLTVELEQVPQSQGKPTAKMGALLNSVVYL